MQFSMSNDPMTLNSFLDNRHNKDIRHRFGERVFQQK